MNQSLGSHIGSMLGAGVQTMLGKITGLGDYKVRSNTLLTGGMSPPEIANSSSRGAVVVRHREYINDITASSAFVVRTYPINPGIVSTFPWLAQVAANYEEYIIRGMIFEFKSTSSDAILAAGGTQALGTVIMATQYDVYNPTFTDKVSMENYQFANSSKPSESFLHTIECQPKQTPVDELYVRTSLGVVTGADQRLYDFGSFNIATQGQQANAGILGELWCTYEIELYKPKNVGSVGYELLTDHYELASITNTSPLGSGSFLAGGNLGTTLNSAGTRISFPPNLTSGTFLISVSWYGTSVTFIAPLFSIAAGSSGGFVQIWNQDGQTSVSSTGQSGTAQFFNAIVRVTSTTGPITQMAIVVGTAGNMPGPPTSGDMWITQINGGINT
jgi:hypothetical protein